MCARSEFFFFLTHFFLRVAVDSSSQASVHKVESIAGRHGRTAEQKKREVGRGEELR